MPAVDPAANPFVDQTAKVKIDLPADANDNKTKAQIDDSALRYYATSRDLKRLGAEMRRLKTLYPDWQPPKDLFSPVASVNEQLWIGHFDLWTHTGIIMHRQALVLPGGLTASTAQCVSMLDGAIHACERYYPAFNFVVWAGKSPQEAMAAAMFDVEGEA